LQGLSEREIKTLEVLIEANKPLGFEELSKKLGVSRVTVGEYLQKLIERGLVEEVVSFGKMKRYKASEKLKSLL
jgi:predicted transcriptional regulator